MVDPFGLWMLEAEAGGDQGTRFFAVQETGPGNTLWDLSRMLTGSGANWKEFGFTGDPTRMQACRIEVTKWVAPIMDNVSQYANTCSAIVRIRANLGLTGKDPGQFSGGDPYIAEMLSMLGIAGGFGEMAGVRMAQQAGVFYIHLPISGRGAVVTGTPGALPPGLTVLKWAGRAAGGLGAAFDLATAVGEFKEGRGYTGTAHLTFSGGAVAGLIISGPVGWTAGIGAGIGSITLGVQKRYYARQFGEQLKSVQWQHEQWMTKWGPEALETWEGKRKTLEEPYKAGLNKLGQFSNWK